MDRARRLRDVERVIGRRELAWFGIRGHDAAPLLALPQFTRSFSITAPLDAGALTDSVALEDITRRRVDVDTYDIDFDESDAARQLRGEMLRALNRPSVLLSYRPSRLAWDLGFALANDLDVLGLYKDRHRPYEYKPWVETQLAKEGVRQVPWRYVADEHRPRVQARLQEGSLVLRVSRSSGGVGIVRVDPGDDLSALWPSTEDHLCSVAPYLENALPLNASGVVFADGAVVLHPASVQLIGIAGATERTFGYCGNDFGAFAALDEGIVKEFEEMVRIVGSWLARDGYVGAFGVDALVHQGEVLFAELNPRLQGSTSLSSEYATRLGHSSIVLDHLAAQLGIEAGESMGLLAWAGEVPAGAHLVVHAHTPIAREPSQGVRHASLPRTVSHELQPGRHVVVEADAVVARLVFDHAITADGYSVSPDAREAIRYLNDTYDSVRSREAGE